MRAVIFLKSPSLRIRNFIKKYTIKLCPKIDWNSLLEKLKYFFFSFLISFLCNRDDKFAFYDNFFSVLEILKLFLRIGSLKKFSPIKFYVIQLWSYERFKYILNLSTNTGKYLRILGQKQNFLKLNLDPKKSGEKRERAQEEFAPPEKYDKANRHIYFSSHILRSYLQTRGASTYGGARVMGRKVINQKKSHKFQVRRNRKKNLDGSWNLEKIWKFKLVLYQRVPSFGQLSLRGASRKLRKNR